MNHHVSVFARLPLAVLDRLVQFSFVCFVCRQRNQPQDPMCQRHHRLLHRPRQTIKMSSQRHCHQPRYVLTPNRALFSPFTFHLIDNNQKFILFIFNLISTHEFTHAFCLRFSKNKTTCAGFPSQPNNNKKNPPKCTIEMHKHTMQIWPTTKTHTHTHHPLKCKHNHTRIDGSQAFNNTQRPARNPEIAQSPSTNIRTTNSIAPTNGVFNRFGADDDDASGGDSAVVTQSVAVCFVFFFHHAFYFLLLLVRSNSILKLSCRCINRYSGSQSI